MHTELEALESKVEQVLGLVHQLQAENEVLRNQMTTAENERMSLRQKMNVAAERLEALTANLPEED